MDDMPNGLFAKTDSEFHRNAFKLRGWSLTAGAKALGLSYETVFDILHRRTRRDENGQVSVEVGTLVKIYMGYRKFPPIYRIVRAPQGPPVRREMSDKMVNPLFSEERLRVHAELEEVKERNRMERVKRARQTPESQ